MPPLLNFQMRTNVPHSIAIGDIVGQPMLGHKALPSRRPRCQKARKPGSRQLIGALEDVLIFKKSVGPQYIVTCLSRMADRRQRTHFGVV